MRSSITLFVSLALAVTLHAQELAGRWETVQQKSSNIDLYGTLTVDMRFTGSTVTVINTWGRGRSFTDSMTLPLNGTPVQVKVTSRVFPSNVFMGLMMPVGSNRVVSATRKGDAIILAERYGLHGSQGTVPVTSSYSYAPSGDGETMTVTIDRSTRKEGPPIRYALKREGSAHAYMMKLEDNWEITGQLPTQAFLISLQGLANLNGPNLYFVYPEKWDFLYTPDVLNYYKEKRNYTFTELHSPAAALKTFASAVKGYVVWDKAVRTSLMVAFTIAGLEKAVVVSEEMIPLVEKEGIKPVADLRGKFAGMSDLQMFTWAYDKYWDRCSREYIVWLGGESGNIMKPGVADFGIYKQAFFTDASTEPVDSAEYRFADKLLGQMKHLSMVMGWHSYAKDKERDYVTLTSHHTLRVEGLHTLPNMSFSCQTPASKGFVWKNNHNVKPGMTLIPEKKVYLALVQTDGMGLGAWFKPGRGAIPCGWEVTMNYEWLAPAMLEFFYGMATPNDYFVGGLSGPGYMYPKAIPKKSLPEVVAMTRKMTMDLDLPVFEFMDYSQGATVEGNTDLTEDIFEAYVKGMPEATGFINGYAPSHTFAVRDRKPLVSFDYYLSEVRPEADAAADLEELAAVNAKRPYFLLIHIREYSDLQRTKNILDRLGPQFELVPLDVFLALAAKAPTFEERFLKK